MAMSLGSGSEEELNSTINTTPLVDVMLVLLIIFLITIPVITKTVKVSLPKAANIATETKPENITIAVDSQGNVYWNNEQVSGRDQLVEMIKAEAIKDPQPEIHIRGDANSRYEDVGRVLYSVQRGGIVKVGFITEPDRGIRGSR
ncbi:MAG: biopolymer transporter ExbD [Gammaproteobacteria bacterium]|jgi:biopolymer transport protein ExbD|nr:biopolymer transporter ExbD [Gammaproteobacteria bacterium]